MPTWMGNQSRTVVEHVTQPHASATVTNYAGWLFVDFDTFENRGPQERKYAATRLVGLWENLWCIFLSYD